VNATAQVAATAALKAIENWDGALNCFTTVLAQRAMEEARIIDAAPAPLPLAGMTFAVKNLFDIAGVTTLAGSKILAERAPAARDALVVARLKAAGATLLGALNMDEFAYGFSTENAHYGPTCNPHDPKRIAGGSSGGSAAAVAAGLVDIALGSDTNGSIRIPASLCGTYGLKPTFGRLPRRGTFPFVASLDHVGHFARRLSDLSRAFDAMQGFDPEEPTMRERPFVDTGAALVDDGRPLRVARLGGWFTHGMTREVERAVLDVAAAAGASRTVELDGAQAARSAAFVLSAAEGGELHLQRLRQRPQDFDFATRDRLLAGALLPARVVLRAQRIRTWFRQQAVAAFVDNDLLIAPATFTTAPAIGQRTLVVDGREIPIRANLGIFTQPLSFIGLPVLSAPIAVEGLPIGVQIIAPAWREDVAFRLAARLAKQGVLAVKTPVMPGATAYNG
jgi:AtzE family amidohydrolase